jgi:PST family polysaccharide transporter
MPNHSESSHQAVSVKSSLYWNTLLCIPSQIVYFAISIIVARILMPRDYGILGIAMMIIGYANVFTNFGFNQAIVQKRIVDKRTLNSIFTFDLSISILIATGFFFAAGFIAEFFRTPECAKAVRVLCLVFIITSFYGLPHAILRRDMNFKAVSLIEVLHSWLMSAVTLLLAIKGWGYWALVYGQLVPLFVIAFVLCIKAGWIPFVYFNNSLMKRVYDFGAWNFLRAQLAFVSQHVDKFVVGRWLGPVSLGYYDKSISIAEVPGNSILMNINAVMFSSFSKNQESKDELQEHFKKSLTLTALIIFPIYTGLIVIAPYFVHSLLGEKWSPMIFPFQIILFGFIFRSFGGLIASLNVAIGKYRNYSLRLLAAVTVFIFACLLFLRFGLNGIAFSFVVFSLTLFLLTVSLAISQIEISWIEVIGCILPGLTSAIIMACCVEILSYYFLTAHSILNLMLLSSIGAVIYLLCSLTWRTEEIMEFRKTLLIDIKKMISAMSR